MTSLFTSSKHAVEGFPMIPDSNILWGHLHLMRHTDFRASVAEFSQKHADANGRCCFWLGSVPALSVTRAADVQYVLKHSSHRRFFGAMEKHFAAFLGRNNVGMLSGKEWKRQRAVIVKALHTAIQGDTYGQLIKEATEQLVDSVLRPSSSDGDTLKKRELGDLMKMVTMDCFGLAALHRDFGCCKELKLSQVAESFEFLANEMMRRMTWGMLDPTSSLYQLPTPRNIQHAKHSKVVRSFIGDIIKERLNAVNKSESKDEPSDLLTALIRLNGEDAKMSRDDLTDGILSDSVLSLLFAGYETSSVTLTYALYLITNDSAVEGKCLNEIGRVYPSTSADDYPYIEAVLTETLRLYPPAVSTTRALEKDLVLDGITIPKNTYMYVPIWAVQRDLHNFENAEDFLPERWLDSNVNKDGFVAFSAGARSCPGQKFAMKEMIIALAVLLRRLRLTFPDDYELVPHRSGIVQTPKGGMPVEISERV